MCYWFWWMDFLMVICEDYHKIGMCTFQNPKYATFSLKNQRFQCSEKGYYFSGNPTRLF